MLTHRNRETESVHTPRAERLDLTGEAHSAQPKQGGFTPHAWIAKTLMLLALILVPAAAAAEDNPRAVADRYIAAYEAADWDTLASLWAEDGVFIDPTSLQQAAGGYHFEGREAIIAGLKAAFDNPRTKIESADYGEPTVFEASGYVVYSGEIEITIHQKADDRRMLYKTKITTILHVQDGKVVEHRDYADYAGASFEEKP